MSEQRYTLLCEDFLDVTPTESRVHAIVTDPPYLYGGAARSKAMMGREWDAADDPVQWHRNWLKHADGFLRPGGFVVSFAAGRTYHWLAMAAELEGYTIHPMLHWVRTNTMPKAADFLKKWEKKIPPEQLDYMKQLFGGMKYGTQSLKPSVEPILLAQKPYDGSVLNSVHTHGAGLLNVQDTVSADGSYPGNWLVTGLDLQDAITAFGPWVRSFYVGDHDIEFTRWVVLPTAGAKERDLGLEGVVPEVVGGMSARADGSLDGKITKRRNRSIAVKPLALMQWLIRLTVPPGGSLIDPFAGSGSTGVAALKEGRRPDLVEREERIFSIAEMRLSYNKQAELLI